MLQKVREQPVLDRRIEKKKCRKFALRSVIFFSVIKEVPLQAAQLSPALVQFYVAVTQICGNQLNHRNRKVEKHND